MLSADAEGTLLSIRVVPGAKKSAFAGEQDGRLKVRLQAPPVEGKANKELLRFLAAGFGLKKNRVSLAGGLRSREKVVLLAGVPLAAAREMVKTALREE